MRKALVTELYDYIEQELGFDVYVDWKDSPKLDRSRVDRETANHLRRIMRHARSLIFVVGKNPEKSLWTPWELGFFDGRQSAQRIRIYLPEGFELPPHQEYLGLYGSRPLRKSDLKNFLEEATLDVAAMDSAQSDQWIRHLQQAMTRPYDYWLSVLQWQFGYAANLMTERDQENLMPDEQPYDIPREPAELFEPCLKALREMQGAIRDFRMKLHSAHLSGRGDISGTLPLMPDDWKEWMPFQASPFGFYKGIHDLMTD